MPNEELVQKLQQLQAALAQIMYDIDDVNRKLNIICASASIDFKSKEVDTGDTKDFTPSF